MNIYEKNKKYLEEEIELLEIKKKNLEIKKKNIDDILKNSKNRLLKLVNNYRNKLNFKFIKDALDNGNNVDFSQKPIEDIYRKDNIVHIVMKKNEEFKVIKFEGEGKDFIIGNSWDLFFVEFKDGYLFRNKDCFFYKGNKYGINIEK